MSSFGSSTIPYLSMVPKPNYHIRQAYSPPINFNLLGEVVYDYGDLSILVDLDEFAVNPVEPQGACQAPATWRRSSPRRVRSTSLLRGLIFTFPKARVADTNKTIWGRLK